jgi:transglutaminase-like putative cysteine protease
LNRSACTARALPTAAGLLLVFLLLAGGLAGARPAAAELAPVSQAERALTTVPGEPNAAAVLLFKNAEFWMMDLAKQEVSSRLRVWVRVKILTEAGKTFGEVEIPHSRRMRLSGFQGRTVLPDGRVVPVPADAKFVRKTSARDKRYVTAVAFPGVEIGAILDYEYTLHFDSFFLVEPWYFSSDVPVLHSEIVYHIPSSLGVQAWSRDPYKAGIKSESNRGVRGTAEARFWADNLPAIPAEPFGYPFRDLATRAVVIPTVFAAQGERVPMLEDWKSASRLMLDVYDPVFKDASAARRRARALAGAKTLPRREQAAALFRFVRDEIETESLEGPFISSDLKLDRVLEERRGDSTAKALLLMALLREVDIPAQPVWAASRDYGMPDLAFPNPDWFDRVLVAAEVDGQRLFLDPGSRSLGPGHLPAGLEGTAALIPDRKKPETLTLPEAAWEQNLRRVTMDVALDESGRLAGSGRIALAGHHAGDRIGWKGEAATVQEAWTKWLEERQPGFAISDVAVEESADERKVAVRWKLAQREEEVLGDEAAYGPSRPLGPVRQPFVLPTDKRRSPVTFAYADRDELELTLTWPQGWAVEAAPDPVGFDSEVGAFAVEVERDDAARRLVFRRRFDTSQRQVNDGAKYTAIRALYGAVEKSDAQAVALARR